MRRPSVPLGHRSADLVTEFGLDWATKLFGAEAIASLPVRASGKNKGSPKGYVHWRKAAAGGWCAEVQSAVRAGQIVDAWIGKGPLSLRSDAVSGKWMGRIQPIGGSTASLFQEGRDRWAAEQQRYAADALAQMADSFYNLPADKQAQMQAKHPERVAAYRAFLAQYPDVYPPKL